MCGASWWGRRFLAGCWLTSRGFPQSSDFLLLPVQTVLSSTALIQGQHKFIPPASSPWLTTWQWGMASVDNKVYRLHCHCPGIELTTHTMRGPNWSILQCIRDLSHIPMASQATVDMTVSVSFMVQKLVNCLDEDARQTGHGHPGYPSMSVSDITGCATQSH
jgi:hypothetical protein